MDYRIYVACLSSYNNGTLHGAWIDLDGKDANDVRYEIQEMLKESPMPDAEEYAIHDYELPFRISEYEDLDNLVELVEGLEEHGEAFEAFLSDVYNEGDPIERFNKTYVGSYKDPEDWAYEYMTETMDIPEHLKFYIDYEAFARDAEITDMIFVQSSYDECHVFYRD